MTKLVPHAILIAAHLLVASWTGQEYKTAHEKSLESGQPLLVLVGADWCKACRMMKAKVMPEVERSGALDDLQCAEIDINDDADLAKEVANAKTVPCLVLFKKTEDGWQRWKLSGMQDQEAVQAFLERHTSETVAAVPNEEESAR